MNTKLEPFILRSKKRREILEILSKERLTPAQIMKRTKMYESHVSRALKELLEKGLIECENPEERRFRFYIATDKGKKIFESVKIILEEIEK